MEFTCKCLGVKYRTNKNGEGLWIRTTDGMGQDWDKNSGCYIKAWGWKQIMGTGDFSATSKSNLYAKIYKEKIKS